MSAQPCLPQELIEVNRNKEYTLISSDLLESVLTDPRLNAQTSKLWQILFNKARYNPILEVKISYSYLAKMMSKSTRTIARYMESLQKLGYLLIKHNFDKSGAQRPSTVSVRVPSMLIEHAKKKKDRVNKKHSVNNKTLLFLDRQMHVNGNYESSIEEEACSVSTGLTQKASEGPSENIHVLRETASDNSDKNDRGGYDINDIQKDNDKKELNKNNNNVVPLLEDQRQITAIQDKIDGLKKQLTDGNKKLPTIKDSASLYVQIRKNSEIEAALYLAKHALERVQHEINEKNKQNQMLSKLRKPDFILNKAGERPLPTFTFKRLVKSLQSYGYCGNTLHVLINEIIFEARFGSLINCNKTKMPLSIDNAINIGLKLVREKRWSTPAFFTTKENMRHLVFD